MASIALIVVGCIDCRVYGTIFTRAMFRPKIKLYVFFSPEKLQMSAGGWWGAQSKEPNELGEIPRGIQRAHEMKEK
jgi:hypothetical protein